MRRQIVIGKQSYRQTMIELGLKISFVLSRFPFTYILPLPLRSCVTNVQLILTYLDLSIMFPDKGMKRKDGYQRMEKQVHLLRDEKKNLQGSGKDLVIAMHMYMPAILEIYLMRGRNLLLQRKMLHLGESIFLCPLKVMNQYVKLYLPSVIFLSVMNFSFQHMFMQTHKHKDKASDNMFK